MGEGGGECVNDSRQEMLSDASCRTAGNSITVIDTVRENLAASVVEQKTKTVRSK